MAETKNSATIADRIRELRKEKGMTQTELAGKLSLTDKAVSKWESGEGAPNIEALADLAAALDTSVDYLLTGKAPIEKTVVMSKKELAAKEDDVKSAKAYYGDFFKESTGELSLFEYVKKYSSKKILTDYSRYYYDKRRLYWNEDFVITLIDLNLRDALNVIGAGGINPFLHCHVQQEEDWNKRLGDHILAEIFSNPKVQDETRNIYFGLHANDTVKPQTPWMFAYRRAFDAALAAKNEKGIDFLIGLFHEINKDAAARYAADTIKKDSRTSYDKCFGCYVHEPNPYVNGYDSNGIYHQSYCFMVVSPDEVRGLISAGFFRQAIAEDAYNKTIGAPTVDPSEIELAQMKLDGVEDGDALRVQALLKSGILNVDTLIATNDFKFIKKTIMERPILVAERLYGCYKKGDLKTIYRFYVDNRLDFRDIIDGKKEDIEASLIKCFTTPNGNVQEIESGNRKYFKKTPQFYGWDLERNPERRAQYLEEMMGIIADAKKQIVDDLSQKIDRDNIVKDLTSDYLKGLVDSGDLGMAVIKICVKMEAILHYDKHYEGDFFTMMDAYCRTFNTTDDEGNDYDTETPALLNKLRMRRNQIVHPAGAGITMTKEELLRCIGIAERM